MFFKVAILAFIASVSAQSLPITIISPAPDFWWVSGSQNVYSWRPCTGDILTTVPSFNVIVRNDNQNLLAGNLTIAGPTMTLNCGVTFTPQNIPVGTGYTMFFTQATDTTQVVASIQFEMKAAGSLFPASTITDLPASTSAPASASGTSGAPAATTSTGSHNSAAGLSFQKQGVAIAALGVVAVVAALL